MDVQCALDEIARNAGGLVTRIQATAAGISDQRLTELVRRGAIARVARGVYAIGEAAFLDVDPAAITTSWRVVLSHESAAAWYGADLPEALKAMHVTAPRNRARRSNGTPGIRVHRFTLSGDDVCVVRGVLVTSPLRTALDIARHLSVDHAVAIVDALIRLGRLSYDDFVAKATEQTGRGAARVKLIAHLVSPKSGSILESLTRVLLWRNDLPDPTPQFSFRHPRRGWIGYMDFAWPELKAILECDGYEYHADRATFQKDRRRWTAVGTAGWHLAVVTWFDVVFDPDYVVAVVRELLAIERGSNTQTQAS
jgi:hypothetical protein